MVDGKGSAAPDAAAADRRGEPSTSEAQNPGPSSKPRRFLPTVTQRRKKPAGDGSSVKLEEDDSFKDLLRQAQEPSNWEQSTRGRGRGRGRGRDQQKQTVAFGAFGTDGGRGGITSTARTAPGSAGRKAGSSQTSGKGKGSRPGGLKLSSPKAENFKWGDEPAAKLEPEDLVAEDPIDYDTYYPSILPARPPGDLPEVQLDASAALPEDLSLVQLEERNVAETLGLLRHTDGQPPLFLLHMPPLPSAPPQPDSKDLSDRRHRLLAASSSASHPTPQALDEYPPGILGKLLVYESGKVKLLAGDALLDVELASNAVNSQQLMALHMEDRTAVLLGDVSLRAFCSPNADQLLGSDPLPALTALPSKPVPMAAVKEEPAAVPESKAAQNGRPSRGDKPIAVALDDDTEMKCG